MKKHTKLCLFLILSIAFSACAEGNAPSEQGAAGGEKPSEGQQEGLGEAEGPVGLWHCSPVLGSGWNRRLLLEGDGTFYWAESQMDALSRMRFKIGRWEAKDGVLNLSVSECLTWEGGNTVSSPIYTDGELVGYRVKKEVFDAKPETEALNIGQIAYDSSREAKTLLIEGETYWDYTSGWDIQALKEDYLTMEEKAE